MAPKIIVSYDGTHNDDDALVLGRAFRDAGATLALAYVRHFQEQDAEREKLAQQGAERLLERGAQFLGDPSLPRHIVLSGATGEGLWQLAEREQADVVVFGSDYRTAPGHVQPGTSAQRLLEGGPAAVAIAPAGISENTEIRITTVAAVAEGGDPSARETAQSVAQAVGATVVPGESGDADLVVVGSRADAPEGRVLVSASAGYRIETSRTAVLVVPRAKAVRFAAVVAHAV
jgi:nucleotide-binding universal stress UspA family protein